MNQPGSGSGVSLEAALLTLLNTSDKAVRRQDPDQVEETVRNTEGLLRFAGGLSTEPNDSDPDTTQ